MDEPEQDSPLADRRKADRLPAPLRLYYEVLDKAGSVQLECEVRAANLSGSGLKFPCPRLLETGTRLRVQMWLPGQEEPVVAGALVVWSQALTDPETGSPAGADLGVHLEEMPPDAAHRYFQFICDQLLTRMEG
ncbi:MAG: PilZ domain-containing protein [Candidatus Omnitrophica bacterium]|nr:PilZ domain-containing protein [Candidatus Omnitrophota bacterium]